MFGYLILGSVTWTKVWFSKNARLWEKSSRKFDRHSRCHTISFHKVIYITWYNLKCGTARGYSILWWHPFPSPNGRGGVCLSQDNDYPGCAGWPGAVVATTHHTSPLPLHHLWIGRYHYILYMLYDHMIIGSLLRENVTHGWAYLIFVTNPTNIYV